MNFAEADCSLFRVQGLGILVLLLLTLRAGLTGYFVTLEKHTWGGDSNVFASCWQSGRDTDNLNKGFICYNT